MSTITNQQQAKQRAERDNQLSSKMHNYVADLANVQPQRQQGTHNHIDELARKATSGTLKRIYTATGNKRILDLMRDLQADFANLDNGLDNTVSDAYDIYLCAYEYLHYMIICKGYGEQTTLAVTLKGGKEKTRTVYQWACVAARKYIYSNKAIDSNGKYVYIEDMGGDDEDGNNALDREYIRMGKYDGIEDYSTYDTYKELRQSLRLTDRQDSILTMRMQGMSVTVIADKLQVSQQAISKQLTVMQERIQELCPDTTRAFRGKRSSSK
jgi:hypothetical protein